jgi:hypothetical protein
MPSLGRITRNGGLFEVASPPRDLRREQREIIARLDASGFDPYRGTLATRLEPLDGSPAVDLGRDVKSGWHLPVVVAERARRQAHLFALARDGLELDAMTHIMVRHGGGMVSHGELWEAYGAFNARLTDAMEALKRTMGFQWWGMAIHPRWDGDAMAFDLHAHITGWLPMALYGRAMEVLGRFFVDPWIRPEPTEDADASAAYPAAGLVRDVNVSLPVEALEALAEAPKGTRLIRTAREVVRLAREAEDASGAPRKSRRRARPAGPETPGVKAIATVRIRGHRQRARVVRYKATNMPSVDTSTLKGPQVPNRSNPDEDMP